MAAAVPAVDTEAAAHTALPPSPEPTHLESPSTSEFTAKKGRRENWSDLMNNKF